MRGGQYIEIRIFSLLVISGLPDISLPLPSHTIPFSQAHPMPSEQKIGIQGSNRQLGSVDFRIARFNQGHIHPPTRWQRGGTKHTKKAQRGIGNSFVVPHFERG